jgi:Transaldolase/Fructose-6-phosphate aldolase
MNPLLQLSACGQSYWLDNLSRDMLSSGELQRRVTEQGLRGITSNPATFHKAIIGSQAYDAEIKRLVEAGRDLAEIYEQLTVADVQHACDILRPVYDCTRASTSTSPCCLPSRTTRPLLPPTCAPWSGALPRGNRCTQWRRWPASSSAALMCWWISYSDIA